MRCGRILDQWLSYKDTMKVKTRKRYSDEFKTQAVELAELGKPVSEVAKDLSISSDLVYRWRREMAGLLQRKEDCQGETDELRRLRREVADLKVENDILKKAAVILGTTPLPKPAK